jgi:hypothetical protein
LLTFEEGSTLELKDGHNSLPLALLQLLRHHQLLSLGYSSFLLISLGLCCCPQDCSSAVHSCPLSRCFVQLTLRATDELAISAATPLLVPCLAPE